MTSRITSVRARQILDSRGRPTVEVDVALSGGASGRAAVPSGASTGRYEAIELRDQDGGPFAGLGVSRAVANVNDTIAAAVEGAEALNQQALDDALITLDGSPQLGRLGANAILAVSLATARAAANAQFLPLHRHINALVGNRDMTMPMPMVNILSGGAHAGRAMDIQDFLMIPVGAQSYDQALAMIARVRACAADIMAAEGLPILLADEGGLSPGYATIEQSLDLMMRSFEAACLKPGDDVAIALDVAASELRVDDKYQFNGLNKRLSSEDMQALFVKAVRSYPIVSIEDALDQDDWSRWSGLTRALGEHDIQLVGDDLFATNVGRIRQGIDSNVCNAVLIKLNQNGTLSGTIKAMQTAWSAGYATVVSARSGETEDSFIADLAVGSGGGQIKIGSLRNSERLAKYNQLTRLQDDAAVAPLTRFPFSGAFGATTATLTT